MQVFWQKSFLLLAFENMNVSSPDTTRFQNAAPTITASYLLIYLYPSSSLPCYLLHWFACVHIHLVIYLPTYFFLLVYLNLLCIYQSICRFLCRFGFLTRKRRDLDASMHPAISRRDWWEGGGAESHIIIKRGTSRSVKIRLSCQFREFLLLESVFCHGFGCFQK